MSNKHLNRRPIPPAYRRRPDLILREGEIWQTRHQWVWAYILKVDAEAGTAFVNCFYASDVTSKYWATAQEVVASPRDGVFHNKVDQTKDLTNRIWSPGGF